MEWLAAIASIIVINVVLSGDNAVVIGMAAHRLPAARRRLAIVLGAGGAVVVRIVLTAVAALLLDIPYLKLLGGALLLWIAFQLLKGEEEEHEGAGSPETIRAAIQTIIVADIVMSVDNVLGVAAAAHGDTILLLFGLVLSMPIVMLGGGLIAGLLDHLWWLAYLGSGVIAWTSLDLMVLEPAIAPFLTADGLLARHVEATGAAVYEPTLLAHGLMAGATLAVLVAAHLVHRHRPSLLSRAASVARAPRLSD
ncbi:MAG: YjbE family putative metal transport protein [Chloroflexi bacterium]|nr:YjbE family putative metal transport protein [Chloroflexota bacterium]